MKIGSRGIYFTGMYTTGSPSPRECKFTDEDGATFFIEANTLLRMAELVKFDLERNGTLNKVMEEFNK